LDFIKQLISIFVIFQFISQILKQENKCNSCNQDIIDGDYEADHIIPWTNGGKTIESNLQILHKRCHQIKSN